MNLSDFIRLENAGEVWQTKRGIRRHPATFLVRSLTCYVAWVERRKGKISTDSRMDESELEFEELDILTDNEGDNE